MSLWFFNLYMDVVSVKDEWLQGCLVANWNCRVRMFEIKQLLLVVDDILLRSRRTRVSNSSNNRGFLRATVFF